MPEQSNHPQKYSLSNGNKALRDKNYAAAMLNYVGILAENPGLSKIVVPNMRLTRARFGKGNNPPSLILQRADVSEGEESFAAKCKKWGVPSNAASVFCSDDAIRFGNDTRVYIKDSTGEFTALCAAEYPAGFVCIESPDTTILMLGLMYRLVWRAQVTVCTESSDPILLDRYIEEIADLETLAKLSFCVNDLTCCLFGINQGRGVVSDKVAEIEWPRRYRILGQIRKELLISDHAQYLINLFNLALGRAPQPHEEQHYLGQMQSGHLTHVEMLDTVLAGEESQRHLKNTGRGKYVQSVYPEPKLGDINPCEIQLPYYDQPLVSVLVPVYGKLEYTLACLRAIEEHLPKATFEVLVLDDKSPDDSVQKLKKVKNLRVIENPQNLGFLRSCNYGATKAKGEYLFFLNNDTQVKEGWLDELILTFENFPGCGLAGSKLIYPDGKLQEAGGIIWEDGSAWNYGRGDDPAKPEYNYAREVDYCSGAAILIRKSFFEELGCFDERYVPAYCEDSDLALTVRNAGYRVIYQPLSEVVHFEGVSSGTDLNSGVKAYQVTNMKTQFTKWQKLLSTHGAIGIQPWLERDRDSKGRILFIDATTPTPDKDSGSIDTFNLMIMFRDLGYHVSFIPEDNFAFIQGYTQDLQRNGIYAIFHPYTNSVQKHLEEYGDNYDIVLIFRPDVAKRSIDVVRQFCKRAKIVYNTVDLHFLRIEREAALLGDKDKKKEANRYKNIEFNNFLKADASTVISEHELKLLTELDKDLKIFNLPYSRGITDDMVPFDRRNGIVFVGSFKHPPNLDAVNYFCRDIFPIIVSMDKNLILHIVGSECPDEVYDLRSENVAVHGYIEDLNDFLKNIRVNIVPLRYGAGIKGKLGGALSQGLPTVSTNIGAEGMGIVNGNDGVYITDDKHIFANYVVELHNDPEKWKIFSELGLAYAKKTWGYEALYSNLKKIFTELKIEIPKLNKKIKLK